MNDIRRLFKNDLPVEVMSSYRKDKLSRLALCVNNNLGHRQF